MTSRQVLYGALAILLSAAWTTSAAQGKAQGGDVVHAVAGIVTKVDGVTKTFAVKTADGTEQVFRYTATTTVHASEGSARGARTAAADTYLAGKESTHVVVHYTGEGTDKTAAGIEDFGQDALKVSKGTVIRVDHVGRTVLIRGEDGTEDTYHVAKDATIDGEHGIVNGSDLVAKDGEKVTVHYSEKAGKKVVRLLKDI